MGDSVDRNVVDILTTLALGDAVYVVTDVNECFGLVELGNEGSGDHLVGCLLYS